MHPDLRLQYSSISMKRFSLKYKSSRSVDPCEVVQERSNTRRGWFIPANHCLTSYPSPKCHQTPLARCPVENLSRRGLVALRDLSDSYFLRPDIAGVALRSSFRVSSVLMIFSLSHPRETNTWVRIETLRNEVNLHKTILSLSFRWRRLARRIEDTPLNLESRLENKK